MNVLVTGANGFVGRAACVAIRQAGHAVIPAMRQPHGLTDERVVGEIGAHTEWRAALYGVKMIVHLAARVHVMQDDPQYPLAPYREVNTCGTLNLARQAAAGGVRRFVFVSSIKVNGEGRITPYTETDTPVPEDAYARSKWEAEQGLRQVAAETGMDVVILRPPLVYGPGVGANFLRLMQMIDRGWPLPLGAIHNHRSVLYLGNLIDAILLCLDHTDAAGQTFLLDDGKPVSTPELIRAIANAMHRPARLLPVPPPLLVLAGNLLGKGPSVSRLTVSLYIDGHVIRERLSWIPPYSMEAGLAATVAQYKTYGHL